MRRVVLAAAFAATACDGVFGLQRVPETDAAAACVPTAIELRASGGQSCVVRTNGEVSCWGDNTLNQVGTSTGSTSCTVGTTEFRCTPTPASPALPAAMHLGMTDKATCAIVGATTYCWGTNTYGELGGPLGNVAVPTQITSRENATMLAGGEAHMCSLDSSGNVLCAGRNMFGEVGDGTATMVTTPKQVLANATAITAGYNHSCAVVDGNVWCWGANAKAQVTGSSASVSAPTPTLVAGITTATHVAAGVSHSCALLGDGNVKCWGDNTYGQGAGISMAKQVTAGVDHTCALLMNGDVRCWGDATLMYTTTGMRLPLPGPAKQIASGSYHDCALLEDATVWCMGWNAYGQLGNGTVTNTYEQPVAVKLCD